MKLRDWGGGYEPKFGSPSEEVNRGRWSNILGKWTWPVATTPGSCGSLPTLYQSLLILTKEPVHTIEIQNPKGLPLLRWASADSIVR